MIDQTSLRARDYVRAAIVVASCLLVAGAARAQEDTSHMQTTGGLTVYYGIVPAAIVGVHPPGHPESMMHGGVPSGKYEQHLVVAVFDAKTNERINDATVQAEIAPIARPGVIVPLEPMKINDTISYGNYFEADRVAYHIKVTVRRPSVSQPVLFSFHFDQRNW
jgi:hypothetical protein